MRLSEAIRLGSLAIQEPEMHNSEKCAIGMGLCAVGKLHKRKSTVTNILDDPNHVELRLQWPWVTMQNSANINGFYGWQPHHGTYEESLYEAFDGEVMYRKTLTLEALCDQVRAWEDELAAKGINVEQVTMIAPSETTHEPAAEKSETLVTRG